jgi:manganese/iron transport system permease protein
LNWLLHNPIVDPLQFSFMRTGLLAAILVGATCAVLGSYVVLRRMAFIGDAIAHTALPGIVIAYLNQWNLFAGALVAGLATALGIGWLSGRDAVREDTAIGVLFTSMFALGILIISTAKSFRDFSHMLFGNITDVGGSDLLLIAVISMIVLATIGLFYKELELTSVDPTYAAVIGLRADRMRNLLLVLLSLAVVSGIQVVGVILTSALLVTPAAAASLLTRDLFRMMIVAAVIAIFSGVTGLYISYYENYAAGPSVVLTCTLCFAAAFTARRLFRRASPRG